MKKQKYTPEVVALIKAAKKMPDEESILEPCASDGSCVCGIKKCDILALQKALKGVGARWRKSSATGSDSMD